MMRCTFEIVRVTEKFMLIRDTGGMVSVTNQADQVVKNLRSALGGRRLFYYDSEGALDELCMEDGKFSHFGFLSPADREAIKSEL